MFDDMTTDDLIIAFYPCIYFCATSQMSFYLNNVNYRCLSDLEAIEKIIQRAENRKDFFVRLIKFCAICIRKGLRMVFENPWSEQTYLKANFLKAPDVVDMDRTERGDVFKKPTAYWFWNCKPTSGETWQKNTDTRTIMSSKGGIRAGLCSEERSMIHPDYARNFICDFILGKVQKGSCLQLDFGEAQ